jgi:nuclear pore complex protein Nup188
MLFVSSNPVDTRGWQDAYSALCQNSNSIPNGLKTFLVDPAVQVVLKAPLDGLPPPSAASKSQLDTLTAAINVTPAVDSPYNIKEIKEDAIWLAGEAKVDEVAALRIVVLEWQKRPAVRLLSGKYDTEDVDQNANIFAPTLPPDGQKHSSAQESVQHRRTHLLKLFLSEQLYILKSSEYILRTLHTTSQVEARQATVSGPADVIFEAFCPNANSSAFLLKCAGALQVRVDRMTNGPEWKSQEDGEIPAQESWLETQIEESITILQLIFDVSVLETKLPSAQSITAMFEFLGNVNFFAHFTESVR